MTEPQEFMSMDEMHSSVWLKSIKQQFTNNKWPRECQRCEQMELCGQPSIRQNSIKFHKIQKLSNYLVVGGILDNICNSACQTCNENLSTMIGGLKNKIYPIVDNSTKFWNLPLERIVHLDINGGEPAASKNYKYILKNLPKNIRSVRINTNCSLIIDDLVELQHRGIKVTITVSFDGVGKIFEYIRWPITWDKFLHNLEYYRSLGLDVNLWTTISALNITDFKNIKNFADTHNIPHSWALLTDPWELDVRYINTFTETAKDQLPNFVAILSNNQSSIDEYIKKQDTLRNISYRDYIPC
jgi:sulfatase maturation enzyme AslB (radical SAM superfamily)